MITSATEWVRNHTVEIGGYTLISGFLGKLDLRYLMATLSNINIVLATLLALTGLAIKLIDLKLKLSTAKAAAAAAPKTEKKEESNGTTE